MGAKLKDIDVIYFLVNPNRVTFMTPYVKLKYKRYPANSFAEFVDHDVLSGMVIHKGDTPEQIKETVEKWKEKVSQCIGVPKAVYWPVSKVKEDTDGNNGFRIMDALMLAVTHYVVPYSHDDIVRNIKIYTERNIEETLDSIKGANLTPRVFQSLKKEDISFIADDCLEYLLARVKDKKPF